MSEDPRDPHLLAALRHAPDRAASPPREVSERILAAARAAVKPAAPAWKRWLDGVAQPQVAGAFGTLAVATIVGVMWATREPAPLASEPVLDAAPRAVIERDAAREAPVAPAASAPVPGAEAPPRAPSVAKRDAGRRNDAPAPTEGRAVARLESPAPAPAARADALAEKKAEAPSPAVPPPAMPGATAVGGALADAPMVSRLRAAPPTPTLAPLAKAGVTEPQRQWWATLQAATAGRWQPIERAPAAAPARTLELDGGAVARLWLDGDAVVVTDTQGRSWRATVGAPTVRDWQAELARW
jgi:hypothetical protein